MNRIIFLFCQVANVVYSSQSPHELYPDGNYIITRGRPEDVREVSSEDEETRDGFRNW